MSASLPPRTVFSQCGPNCLMEMGLVYNLLWLNKTIFPPLSACLYSCTQPRKQQFTKTKINSLSETIRQGTLFTGLNGRNNYGEDLFLSYSLFLFSPICHMCSTWLDTGILQYSRGIILRWVFSNNIWSKKFIFGILPDHAFIFWTLFSQNLGSYFWLENKQGSDWIVLDCRIWLSKPMQGMHLEILYWVILECICSKRLVSAFCLYSENCCLARSLIVFPASIVYWPWGVSLVLLDGLWGREIE